MARLLNAIVFAAIGCHPQRPAPATKAAAGPHAAAAPTAPASMATAQVAPPAGLASAPAGDSGWTNGEFGGERWGFVEASTHTGRLVALRRFAGSERPSFGHHGESSAPSDLALFDTVEQTERPLVEVIDIDPERRWLLVLTPQLFLIDGNTGAWTAINGADTTEDNNRCLPPRVATFSELGKRAAWIEAGSQRLIVRDLAAGTEWPVAARGRLWRGWPDDDGRGATVFEVPGGSSEWPLQSTSCACRWCTRFAASYGFYGWGGPAFTMSHVDESGTRTRSKGSPSNPALSHGPADDRRELKAAASDGGLQRGSWSWQPTKPGK